MALLYQSPEWNLHRPQSVVPFAIVPDLPFFRGFRVTLQGPRATLPTLTYGSAAPSGLGVTGSLVNVSEFQHLDGDQIRYTLTYTTTPPSYTDYQTYAYTYPSVAFPFNQRRDAITESVTARFDYTFALATPQQQEGTDLTPPITQLDAFEIKLDDRVVEYLSDGFFFAGGPTTPTATQYFSSNESLVAESNVRKFLPGLYVRETIRVPRV